MSSELFQRLSTAAAQHGEANDCVVRAIAAATGSTYEDAHAACELAGRKPRRGMPMATQGRLALELLGFKMVNEQVALARAKRAKRGGVTVRTARRWLFRCGGLRWDGSYILQVRAHVAALVEGEVHDWSAERRHRVLSVHRIQRIDA